MTDIGVALLGTGAVGGGVTDLLQANSALIAERTGYRLRIACAASRNVERAQKRIGADIPVVGDWREAVARDDCQIVVELMGGIEEARECTLACAAANKPLVTANKALLATHGAELFKAVSDTGSDIYYEAAVAGCIPAIRTLRDALVGDRVTSMLGIINGTCNYILTRMTKDGIDFEQALAQATELGYAEADPTLDIDGWDAAHKAVIISWLAFGTPLSMDDVAVEGIRESNPVDEHYAGEFDYVVKLVAAVRSTPAGVEVRVTPALVASDSQLAQIDDNLNAVLLRTEAAGAMLLTGAGAGGAPTATAVVSDLVDAARGLGGSGRRHPPDDAARLLGSEQFANQSYMRLSVLDHKGVLAQATSLLADAGISIEAVKQAESHEGAPTDIAMLLHDAPWEKAKQAASALAELQVDKKTPVLLPIAVPHDS